jgi:hypothetical protein
MTLTVENAFDEYRGDQAAGIIENGSGCGGVHVPAF